MFLFMIENYIDEYVSLVQTNEVNVLHPAAQAALFGIYSVFTPPHISGNSGKEPILMKKIINGDGVWAV